MKHRWIGKPQDAKKWHDEKRRHAPLYIVIGAATIVVGLLLVRWRWDSLDPGSRWMPVLVILAFGVTVLAFGPVLFYVSDKHTVYLLFPMQGEWEQDLESTWGALTGYLTTRGVRWQRLRSWTRTSLVLGIDQGLRVMMMVSPQGTDRARRVDIWVSIHRINQGNVARAEEVQRILDEWPFLGGLERGVDKELAQEVATMGP